MRRILTLVLSLMALSPAMAQVNTNNVGIGTASPDPRAILDAANPYNPLTVPITRPKGILVPRLNILQRDLMQSFYNDTLPDGLLIYETDSGYFWYYRHFDPPSPVAPFGTWVKLEVANAPGQGTPQGGIIMWSGTIASIPAGWVLCDGANGTPDLTDKFIVSVASSAENPGFAAGEYVNVSVGTPTAPERRYYKLAYIMKQ